MIGISADSAESHRRFADRFRLPFRLLADTDGAVRRGTASQDARPVPGTGHLPDRREGIVRHIFSSQFQPWRHVPKALRSSRSYGTESSTGTHARPTTSGSSGGPRPHMLLLAGHDDLERPLAIGERLAARWSARRMVRSV